MATTEAVKPQGGKQVRLSTNDDKEQDPSFPAIARRRMSTLSTRTSDSHMSGAPRRRSSLYSVAQSISAIMGVRRKSRAFSIKDKPIVKLENTYKMEPDEGTVFKTKLVQEIVQDVLDYNLKDTKYDPEQCKALTQQLSNTIKNRMKEENFPRYKIVVNVIVGQSGDQGIDMVSRCVWNAGSDRWACATFTNDSLFAIASVHGVYFE